MKLNIYLSMGHDTENHVLMGQSPSIKMKLAYFTQWGRDSEKHILMGYHEPLRYEQQAQICSLNKTSPNMLMECSLNKIQFKLIFKTKNSFDNNFLLNKMGI
jgi:hypothetical protein